MGQWRPNKNSRPLFHGLAHSPGESPIPTLRVVAIAIEYPADFQESTFETGVNNSPSAGLKLRTAADHPPYLLGAPRLSNRLSYLRAVNSRPVQGLDHAVCESIDLPSLQMRATAWRRSRQVGCHDYVYRGQGTTRLRLRMLTNC